MTYFTIMSLFRKREYSLIFSALKKSSFLKLMSLLNFLIRRYVNIYSFSLTRTVLFLKEAALDSLLKTYQENYQHILSFFLSFFLPFFLCYLSLLLLSFSFNFFFFTFKALLVNILFHRKN